MQVWIDGEFDELDLGHATLEDRFRRILDQRMSHPNLSIPAAVGAEESARAEMEATYRFFDNDKVNDMLILEPHHAKTRERIKQEQVALVPQDTTLIELTRAHSMMEGIGPLGGINDKRMGLFDHTLLAMSVDGVPLGLLPGTIWARDPNDPLRELPPAEREKIRRNTPFEEKESFRWVQGYRTCCDLAAECPTTRIVSLADSESDIFELLLETQRQDAGPRASFIIRACQDRALDEVEPGEQSLEHLYAAARQLRKFGKLELEIRARDAQSGDGRKRKAARSARAAECEIRAGTLTVKAPADLGTNTPSVTVNVVYVRERNPPEGEAPIEWLLLTDLPVDSLAAIEKVLAYYCGRWQIEIYFKILKSGCRIEASRLETLTRYRNFLATSKIVAWRLFYLLMLGREQPDLPCTVALEEHEWQAAYAAVKHRPPPETPPTLSEMIQIIARLGGWMGRRCDREPGPKAMWIGFQRMRDFALAWQARELFPPGKPRGKRQSKIRVE